MTTYQLKSLVATQLQLCKNQLQQRRSTPKHSLSEITNLIFHNVLLEECIDTFVLKYTVDKIFLSITSKAESIYIDLQVSPLNDLKVVTLRIDPFNWNRPGLILEHHAQTTFYITRPELVRLIKVSDILVNLLPHKFCSTSDEGCKLREKIRTLTVRASLSDEQYRDRIKSIIMCELL